MMKPTGQFYKAFFAALLWAGFLTAPALAQNYELDITSDRLDIDNNSNEAVFYGNVVVVHDELTLKADEVEVFYSQTEPDSSGGGSGGESGGRGVEIVKARGNVRMEKGSRVATGQRGVYRPGAAEVILTEDVTVRQGEGRIMYGTKMRYDINKGRVRMTSDKDRVRATLGLEE